MKPEKRHLLALLDDQGNARREATLLAGSRVLRARRWRRRAAQMLFTVTTLGIAGLSLQWMLAPQPAPVRIASPAPAPERKLPAHESLTDAELLAMFPDAPVALATLGNGHKRLIFLRPADAERFTGRL